MPGKKFDISKFAATVRPVSESDTMLEIPVGDILDNPRNFYPHPGPEALEALAESIQVNGLLEPPTVVPGKGGKYRLISGHSRMVAVRKLVAAGSDPGRFEKVLCRVLPSMTPEQEDCAVIEANRQRVKSPALLADEAARLTEIYIRRREAGENLPGRIRDRVAEALNVRATKLANLAVIKKGLKVPGFVRKWEAGDIPEAAALKIARMSEEEQYRFLDWSIDNGRACGILDASEFSACWEHFPHDCPVSKGFCRNAQAMFRSFVRAGGLSGCAGCCRSCIKRDACEVVCQHFKTEKTPEPEPKVERNPAADDPRLCWTTMVSAFCRRVKALREGTGMSRNEFAEFIGESVDRYSAMEKDAMYGAEKVAKLALAHGVSCDYLLGLTDDPRPYRDEAGGEA